jgi:hypothetical protein
MHQYEFEKCPYCDKDAVVLRMEEQIEGISIKTQDKLFHCFNKECVSYCLNFYMDLLNEWNKHNGVEK